jgi:hypothetical protein
MTSWSALSSAEVLGVVVGVACACAWLGEDRTDAHANACNTASRTSLLLEFMVSPWLFAVALL